MKTTRRLALCGAVSLSVSAAACGGGSGDPGKPTGDIRPQVFPHDFHPNATPTPAGPIYLEKLSTPDGTNEIASGKCLGFTLVANSDGLSWSPDTKVSVGPFTDVESMLEDGTHLRIGSAANHFTCFYTPLFGEPGEWDVVIENDGETHTLAGAIKVLPPKLLEVGRVNPDTGFHWSMDRVFDSQANVFEVPYDIDIYRVEFFQPGDDKTFSHAEFFPTGAPALLPVMEFREPSHPLEITARGGLGLIFPKRGTNYIVVKDVLGQGGSGATYDLSFATQTAGEASGGAACESAPVLAPATYKANYDDMANNFDPQGGCFDSFYGLPINTAGNDAVWRVTVPAGKQLRVSGYDDHIDNATYLLPIGTGSCPARPTNCVAAASRYGGGNTDTMIYDNRTGADQEFFLVHDSATVMTNGVGAFAFDVQIFDRY